jgi:hypothetical protein
LPQFSTLGKSSSRLRRKRDTRPLVSRASQPGRYPYLGSRASAILRKYPIQILTALTASNASGKSREYAASLQIYARQVRLRRVSVRSHYLTEQPEALPLDMRNARRRLMEETEHCHKMEQCFSAARCRNEIGVRCSRRLASFVLLDTIHARAALWAHLAIRFCRPERLNWHAIGEASQGCVADRMWPRDWSVRC